MDNSHQLAWMVLWFAVAGTVVLAILFYALRWLAASWDRLLWRVRRRLAITYLLVGLTPLVLMAAHSTISWLGLSAEAMARLVTVQIGAATREAQTVAASLAGDLDRFSSPAPPGRRETLIAERARLARASLPGARLTVVLDAALPSWLRGPRTWGGLTHAAPAAPAGGGQQDSTIRAVARGGDPGDPFAVLVEVPLDRDFLRYLGDTTGVRVRPATAEADASPGLFYVALMPSTDWATGRKSEQIALTFDWSWTEAGRQVFGSTAAGRYWRLGLLVLGWIFLGLEVLALGGAAWMVRAVTGTVDRIHRATEFIRGGDFSHRVQIRSRDQLGELAERFNDMSAHIEVLLRERVDRERLQREIEIASEVQARLFPRVMPQMRTVEMVGLCRAARGVAGDYYDGVVVAPGLVALALADVAGKGISASLMMSNLQASLRAQAAIMGDSLVAAVPGLGAVEAEPGVAGTFGGPGNGAGAVSRMTTTINEQFCLSIEPNRFATLFLALYDDRTRLLRYTNAGHNRPILVQPDGTVERLATGGGLVGAFQGLRYQEDGALLRSGSSLLIFSDGITEALNPDGEEYGDDRLVRFAVRHRGLSAEKTRQTLFEEIDGWCRTDERGDDQALLVVKGLPEA
jgi:sigma-B regulation protein RsbU (phosphoserine phosphatase)